MNAIQAKFEAPVQVIACSLNTPPYNSNEIEKRELFRPLRKNHFFCKICWQIKIIILYQLSFADLALL